MGKPFPLEPLDVATQHIFGAESAQGLQPVSQSQRHPDRPAVAVPGAQTQEDAAHSI